MLLLFVAAGPVALAAPPEGANKMSEAAAHFERGQKFYLEGRYPEAIRAYEEANRIAPHASALFNIARCHENLGNPVKALEFYDQALAITKDASSVADIKQRVQRLRSRPVRVFVGSQPSGASVTVGGRATPEEGQTPLVVMLKPGEHLLLVEKDGFQMAAKRVVVEVGQEQPVEVTLDKKPEPCPPPAPPCPAAKPCPRLELTDTRNLHLHLSVVGAFGFGTNRPVAAGPGFQVYLTFRDIYVGSTFFIFPGAETTAGSIPFDGVTYDKMEMRWLLAQVEGGYVFPFRTSYLYVAGGVGVSSDQVVYTGKTKIQGAEGEPDKEVEKTLINEELAFAWTVGGGAEAMLTTWLSLGAAARFGLIHGSRNDADNPGQTDSGTTFPFGLLWATLTFHL